MANAEQGIGAVIVVVLLGLAGFFGLRQLRALRTTPAGPAVTDEDRTYLRRQAWRRLTCSALMAVLAGLLIGWYWLGLDQSILDLVRQAVPNRHLDPGQRRTLNWGLAYISAIVLILMALLVLALLDLLAIRRFGIRHYRQMQADHRAVIAHEVARLRGQRNGQH